MNIMQDISLIREISKEIIKIKFSQKDTLKKCFDRFYKIMRKYKIKKMHSASDGVGMIGNNFEWTMCLTLFIDRLKDYMHLESFMSTPKDLECYDKKEE